MKCKHCDGTGEIINDALRWTSCPVCGGKGFIEKTNEEWRKTCSTEEFAEWMFDIIEFCLNYENYPDKNKYKDLMKTKEDIKMWLKQPHTTKE